MRLISLSVRNYRMHKDLEVAFDPSRTLIGGANEAGKSTLVEAMHRALFLRSKRTGAVLDVMRSSRHTGHPEVALSFEAGGRVWHVEKSFRGQSGVTRLMEVGGAVFSGDEAEARLAELLRTEGAGRQMEGLWAHLWVWQGSAGGDPTMHASAQKDSLIQRLQQEGVGAVMQSELDQRVRRQVTDWHEALFTATGRAKAGSKPEIARLELERAEGLLLQARQAAERLQAAAAVFGRAEEDLREADKALPQLLEERKSVEVRMEDVRRLRGMEEPQARTVDGVQARAAVLRQADVRIRELLAAAEAARQRLLPKEEDLRLLMEEIETMTRQTGSHEETTRQAGAVLRRTRLQAELAAAAAEFFEKQAVFAEKQHLAEEAASVRSAVQTAQHELAGLPPVDERELERLRKLEGEHSRALAARDAMAAGVELLASDTLVRLDGSVLEAGETRVLAEVGEVTIGEGTRLRIRPGGGDSLAAARARVTAAADALTAAFDRLGLRDLAEAAALHEARRTAEQKLANGEARWKAMKGELAEPQKAEASRALEAARMELERRRQVLAAEAEVKTLPASLEAAKIWLEACRQAFQEADQKDMEWRRLLEDARRQMDALRQKLTGCRDALEEGKLKLGAFETEIRVLEAGHGAQAEREAALEALRREEETARRVLEDIRRQITELNPAGLELEIERLKRVTGMQQERRAKAETEMAVARHQLTLDGSVDPHAELAQARARAQDAKSAYEAEERRAQAVKRLQVLFEESRDAVDRSMAQPLAERITGYVRCVFGAGAEARVKLAESGIQGLELLRPGEPAFGFEALSGGAKEQMAAAVRLALAEILAADHDGCLPLVFDDAFAYADPARVPMLQRMLDLAATRGLQIIVLTCTPVDYLLLGAREIRL